MGRTVDDYVGALSGWQALTTAALRRDILAATGVAETLKWNHPVYVSEGPVCLIQAHKAHVSLGFWRGAEMLALDGRLVPQGSFLMASIKLGATDKMDPDQVRRLVEAGVALNREKGDPLKKR
jgi:hypothetical protein